MHRVFLLLVPAAAAFPASGCIVGGASGAPYSQNQSYAGFDKVDVSAGVEVVLAQGNFDVKAESTYGASLDKFIVEVRGKTLHVSRKETMMGWGGGPRYRVNVSAPACSLPISMSTCRPAQRSTSPAPARRCESKSRQAHPSMAKA